MIPPGILCERVDFSDLCGPSASNVAWRFCGPRSARELSPGAPPSTLQHGGTTNRLRCSEARGLTQTLRRRDGGSGYQLPHSGGRNTGHSGAQRRRQEHHCQNGDGAARTLARHRAVPRRTHRRRPDPFKQRLGYVPERPTCTGFLTGWEYLELVATLRGLDRRRFRETAAAMLAGLHAIRQPRRAHRVVFQGHAAAHRADRRADARSRAPGAGRAVFRASMSPAPWCCGVSMARLAAEGKAVLFSSPVLEQVDKLCARTWCVLKSGAVVARAAPWKRCMPEFAGLGLEAGFMQTDGAGGCGRHCTGYCIRGSCAGP